MKRSTAAFLALALAVPAFAEDGARIQELERKLGALTEEVDKLKSGENAPYEPKFGLAPAAAKVYHLKEGVSLGGYGELVYQDFHARKDDGTGSGKRRQVDMSRFILYVGYRFSDKFVFNSEIEIEHAAEDKRGEVSVELVTLDYLHQPAFNLRGGLLLLPVGFINELHEPPIFHGALRPNVERNIIPSTWRENGVGVFGQAGPVAYRTYLVNGGQAVKDSVLGITGGDKVKGYSSSSGIRDGRQKGSSAFAEDLAWVARLDYTGLPGILVGGSFYAGDSGQNAVVSGRTLEAGTTLWEGHTEYKRRGLELRGLYARIGLGDASLINAAQGVTGGSSVGERMWGGYLQAAYNLFALCKTEQYLAPFLRYERYNTQAAVPAGFSSSGAYDRTEITHGLTYRPILNIVVKGEFQDLKNRAGSGVDQWNMALGYLF